MPELERLPTDAVESTVAARYAHVRAASEALCRTLEPEDYVIQSMDDVSPIKWHLAHTSWFFETFLLCEMLPGYRPFAPSFEYLFNSYYNAVGPQFSRPRRGLLSRPTVREVEAYRRHVDEHMQRLLSMSMRSGARDQHRHVLERATLGLHHEQQHQELMLMDIAHVFWTNPLRPVFRADAAPPSAHAAPPLGWHRGPEGVRHIGHAPGQAPREPGGAALCPEPCPAFSFDNEMPRHAVFLQPFALASRCVTNAEYLAFVQDGGYAQPALWLSDGWAMLQGQGWRAPLYWEERDGAWWEMTLGGMKPLDPHAPVVHVSHYEADAYARWAGARLPTEAEWEAVATSAPAQGALSAAGAAGNFVESGRLHPTVAPLERFWDPLLAASADQPGQPSPAQLLGDVWEWTASAYLPYPGFQPAAGAIGEYNGKFMSGQMVLRGGACVTPAAHIRPTYRNFFPPGARWPFTGIRLAKNA